MYADFRPSYTKLSYFKTNFPTVPVLALTATATARVQHDVVAQLGLRSCLLFRSSFNRSNLRYEVRKKPKGVKTVEEMGDLLLSKFSTKLGTKRKLQCGIIYCATIKKCEDVAEQLENFLQSRLGRGDGRKRVKHYHGKLSSEEREQVQSEWTNGDVPVIVATLAFGMGINKADVRFVIHFCVPKSLEGYLQESGRAGRDGLTAHCIVYYSRADVLTHKFMIDKSREEAKSNFGGSSSYETQYMNNIESLNAMSAYCEETCTCRRSMLLQHFGEDFDVKECRGSCDNCRMNQKSQVVQQDVTKPALLLIEVVRSSSNSLSMSLLTAVFRGASTAAVKNRGLHQNSNFGVGKSLKIPIAKVESIVRKLINMVCELVSIELYLISRVFTTHLMFQGILFEKTVKPADYMAITAVLTVNESKAALLQSGAAKVHLSERLTQKSNATGQPNQPQSERRDKEDLNTESSRPKKRKVEDKQVAQKKNAGCVNLVSDDEIEDPKVQVEEGNGEPSPREQLMLIMLPQLNNAIRERLDAKRAVFNTLVQSKLSKEAPRSMEELEKLRVSGVSAHMKQKYGKYLVEAVIQVDAFLGKTDLDQCPLDSFKLDVDALFGPRIMTANQIPLTQSTPARMSELDWGDSDDDWEIMPSENQDVPENDNGWKHIVR